MAFVYAFAQEDPHCPNYHYMISLNTNECTFPYQFLKVEIDKADQIDYAITQLSVLITFPYGTGVLIAGSDVGHDGTLCGLCGYISAVSVVWHPTFEKKDGNFAQFAGRVWRRTTEGTEGIQRVQRMLIM